MKNILITGANGQLGMEMRIVAKGSADRYIFTDVNQVEGFDTEYLDITDLETVRRFVADNKVEAIVNCAAYTNVDAADTNQALAEKLNAQAPENLAKAMKEVNGLLVHISTDYVFGGDPYNTPCREDQKGTPTGVYGLTKLHGEEAIIKTNSTIRNFSSQSGHSTHIFCNGDCIGLYFTNQFVCQLQVGNSLHVGIVGEILIIGVEVGAQTMVVIQHGGHTVKAETIEAIHVHPVLAVAQQEVQYLGLAVPPAVQNRQDVTARVGGAAGLPQGDLRPLQGDGAPRRGDLEDQLSLPRHGTGVGAVTVGGTGRGGGRGRPRKGAGLR